MALLFKPTLKFLSIAIALGLSNYVQADIFSNDKELIYDKECYTNIPEYSKPDENFSIEKTPVSISADRAEAKLNEKVSFEGNVEIEQGHRKLTANKTTFDQTSQNLSAEGNIQFNDGQISVQSDDSLTTNLSTNNTTLKQATYHLNGSLIRGTAKQADLEPNNKTIILEDAMITTCPTNQESWTVTAGRLHIDQRQIFGEAYNTVFRFQDVPVLYLPYINFPIKNQRKTGILYPQVNYSNNEGAELEVPVYFNIAPNYDDTLTTHFYQKRGLLLKNEFRYLPIEGTQGTFYTEYINDRKTEHDYINNDHRWFIGLHHNTVFGNSGFRLDIDYDRVRKDDFNYINDFSPLGISNDQLNQRANLIFEKTHLESSLKVQHYQSLLPDDYNRLPQFSLLPELRINYHDKFLKNNIYNLRADFSNFYIHNHNSKGNYQGQRYHFQPEIEIPIVNLEGLILNATGKGYYTYYNQDIPAHLSVPNTINGFNRKNLKQSASRFLYTGELYGRMTLEKRLENDYTIAIVPEAKYMYTPYKNQDHIGLYDTTDRIYDYASLFNSQLYAGLDRINDNNSVALGVSYKIYDETFRERVRFSIGQGYSFVKRRVKLYPSDTTTEYPRTPIASSINFSILDYITAHGDIIYNTQKSKTMSWNSQLNFAYKDWNGQFGYRYTRDGNRTLLQETIDLKQLGGAIQMPITDKIKAIAVMYYDLKQKRNIDQKLALKYESCCYNFEIEVERYNKPDNITLTAKEETKVGFAFEFKGLSNLSTKSNFNQSTHLLPINNTVNLSE